MNKTILLVEDEAVTAYQLHQDLLSCGFDLCELVSTGKDAIKKLPVTTTFYRYS
ncbi:MAG: hypothetical protein JW996_05050 [Candidatus Cloacimonetes bacterium]|nr:hypothetical protein [Candidatus Cloacimonadota bacterium]